MLKIIAGGKTDTSPTCIVKMDDKVLRFDEFVTIGFDAESGDVKIAHYADAITLGKAVQLIVGAYRESYSVLTDKDKQAVDSILAL